MAILLRLWRGELPLEAAFWHWAVLGGLLVNMATSALFLALVTADRPALALIAGYAPSLPYNVLVTVAVWRAADRYQGARLWADLARLATAAGMVFLSVT
jgi:hypothetical protein